MVKSILDPRFKYVPAVGTDLRKTFARVRREAKEKREAEVRAKVRQLPRTGTK